MVEVSENDRFNSDDDDLERIVGLNSLMDELMKDASSLSRDLIEGVGAIGGAAAIILTIVIIEVLVILTNLWRGPLYIAAWILVMIPMMIFGVRLLLKFFELRERYSRLYEINKELEK